MKKQTLENIMVWLTAEDRLSNNMASVVYIEDYLYFYLVLSLKLPSGEFRL